MGRKGEERRLEVDCGDFTFAVFFLILTKATKKRRREGGWKHKCLRVLAGFSASTQKQNGSVNKKRSLMLVSGTRPRASQAWKRRQHSSASRGPFVGPCVTLRNFPSRNVLPTIKAEWRVLGFSFGGAINRKAWKDWKWTQVCSGWDALRLFCFFYFSCFLLILPSLTPKPRYHLLLRALHDRAARRVQSVRSIEEKHFTSLSSLTQSISLVIFFSLLLRDTTERTKPAINVKPYRPKDLELSHRPDGNVRKCWKTNEDVVVLGRFQPSRPFSHVSALISCHFSTDDLIIKTEHVQNKCVLTPFADEDCDLWLKAAEAWCLSCCFVFLTSRFHRTDTQWSEISVTASWVYFGQISCLISQQHVYTYILRVLLYSVPFHR